MLRLIPIRLIAVAVLAFAVAVVSGLFSPSQPASADVPPYTSIATGGGHSCAVRSDGIAVCWGDNTYGQLGDGTNNDKLLAVYPPVKTGPGFTDYLRGVVDIAAGESHACAVLGDGTAWCWGWNGSGQLGDGTTTDRNIAAPVSGLTDVIAIDAGYWHTCAVRADGTVWCWGDNYWGQLGNGTTTDSTTPVRVLMLTGPIDVAAGTTHTCAVTRYEEVQCWGNNIDGQLGDGTFTNSTTPVFLAGNPDVVDVTAGEGFTCAVLPGGTVKCWGWNELGTLGDGTTTNRNVPVDVVGLGGDAVDVSGGYKHTCAVLADGSGRCWGSDGFGQIGATTTEMCGLYGDIPCTTTPLTVLTDDGPPLADAVAVSSGYQHNVALLSDGRLKSWGYNSGGSGQLGDGTTIDRHTAVDVLGMPRAVGPSVPVQSLRNGCTRRSDGGLYCWGHNYFGQVGDGTTIDRSVPTRVPGLVAVTHVSGGNFHTCAVLSGGDAKCWGYNSNGQLGNNSTTNSSAPVDVSGINDATAVAGGAYHSCALLSDATVWCWGKNNRGQLGNGTTTDSLVPVQVTGLTDAVAIDLADEHSCALLSDGTAKCWGANNLGQLGDGTGTDSSTPVTVASEPGPDPPPLEGIIAVTAGGVHSCALLGGGGAVCWGHNYYGQLGDGQACSELWCFSPTPVSTNSLYTDIDAGAWHTCARASDGSVECWGRNDYGQLANGTTTDSTIPVAVSLPPGEHSVRVGAGGFHTCTLLSSGLLLCAGQNNVGQLGNGTTTDSTTLVATGADTDDDGCADIEEQDGASAPKPGATGPFDIVAWYDFYDVPVPANPDATPNGPKNQAINLSDVLAVLFYVGTANDGGANANGVDYDSLKGSCDWNADTVADKEGLCYDRSPSPAPNPPWEVGPPSGAVNMSDVLAVLAQVGLSCAGPP
jgi:alpha-tubulin suppressor-like RCC1 family protein